MMKFSIIIVTRNAGATIQACLESLASQAHGDFEVVIQDGMSTDDTRWIVEAFRDRHRQLDIRFQQVRDGGVYEAMNMALDRARGDWVLFLGGDDRLFAADTLSGLSEALTDEDDVVYGDVVSPRFNGRYAGRFSVARIGESNICHQAIVIRRRLFETLGRFDVRFRLLADWEHNMRWFLSPNVRARYIDTVIAHYADGGLSSCGNDQVFEREKRQLYIRHGRHSVPFRIKLRILRKEIGEAIATRDRSRLAGALRLWPAVVARSSPIAR
jgi:glycosyltransferase involved in cell wall biosynthesis